VRVSLQRVALRSVGLAVLADDVRARVVVAAAAGSATRFLLPVDFGGNGWKTRRGIGSVGPRRRNPIRWLRLGSFAENEKKIGIQIDNLGTCSSQTTFVILELWTIVDIISSHVYARLLVLFLQGSKVMSRPTEKYKNDLGRKK
jgi:hypothetical protein